LARIDRAGVPALDQTGVSAALRGARHRDQLDPIGEVMGRPSRVRSFWWHPALGLVHSSFSLSAMRRRRTDSLRSVIQIDFS